MKNKIYVPDTSALVERYVSYLISKGKISGKIIIHKAVLSELENQANKGKDIGFIGLKEIAKIRELAGKRKITVDFGGNRPTYRQIQMAKSGEIDNMIRELAWENKGILITGDKVQAEVAKSVGIEILFIEMSSRVTKKLKLEKFFDDETMSVHLREGVVPKAKKGFPGSWKFTEIGNKKMTDSDIKEITEDIIEHTHARSNAFIEFERQASTIVQLGKYRIVITRPPLSDGYEITAVKPVKKLSMEDYGLSEKLIERFSKRAEGILISGAPGHGKSTFAQALAEFYMKKNKVVKTIEAPRDLQLPDEITQYSKNLAGSSEIHDILLLSRPDYTIFDEMRDTHDFKIYSDLRLAGVGMAGVIHGTTPIDSIQRFVGRIELGMITSIIDTVVFINQGEVDKVYELEIVVKVPSGMYDADLSRPVIEIRDFLTNSVEYEMYTFGEETVVVPIKKIPKREKNEIHNLAGRTVEREIRKFTGDVPMEIEMIGERNATIFLDKEDIPKVIGRNGRNVRELENNLGLKINVRDKGNKFTPSKKMNYKLTDLKTGLKFRLGKKASRQMLQFIADDEPLFTVTATKTGDVKLVKGSDEYTSVVTALDSGKELEIYS